MAKKQNLVGKVFQRTGKETKIVIVSQIDESHPIYKVVGDSENKEYSLSYTTLMDKRKWTLLEDEVSTVELTDKVDKQEEVSTPSPKKKESTTKKSTKPVLDATPILDYIESLTADLLSYTREAQPNLKNYKLAEDKSVVLFTKVTKYKVELHTKSKYLTQNISSKLVSQNHNFNVKLEITTLDDDTKTLITEIINSIRS